MRLFALSDPHLSLTDASKSMDVFGPEWVDHVNAIRQNWQKTVNDHDIVVLAGDISWAKRLSQAMTDLLWLEDLPGKKIILRGNHDYWWPSYSKLREALPRSIKAVNNNYVKMGPYVFFGSRLWDTEEYSCADLVKWDESKGRLPGLKTELEIRAQERQYEKELGRLEMSIQSLPEAKGSIRIGLCHYPPLGDKMDDSRAHQLFKQAGAQHVLFGHLHSIKPEFKGKEVFGVKDDIHYHLTSCDFLEMKPLLIMV